MEPPYIRQSGSLCLSFNSSPKVIIKISKNPICFHLFTFPICHFDCWNWFLRPVLILIDTVSLYNIQTTWCTLNISTLLWVVEKPPWDQCAKNPCIRSPGTCHQLAQDHHSTWQFYNSVYTVEVALTIDNQTDQKRDKQIHKEEVSLLGILQHFLSTANTELRFSIWKRNT